VTKRMTPGNEIEVIVDGEVIICKCDRNGTLRFPENKVVRDLLDDGGFWVDNSTRILDIQFSVTGKFSDGL
jgi:hypothetical protein